MSSKSGLEAWQDPPPVELQSPAHVDEAPLGQLPVHLDLATETVAHPHLTLHPTGLRGYPSDCTFDIATASSITSGYIACQCTGVSVGQWSLQTLLLNIFDIVHFCHLYTLTY